MFIRLATDLARNQNFVQNTGEEKASKGSVTRRKLPNVYKSCPKMISLEK